MAKEMKKTSESPSAGNEPMPGENMAGFESLAEKKQYLKIVAAAVASGSLKALGALMEAGCAKALGWAELAKAMGKAIEAESPAMLDMLLRQALIAGMGQAHWVDLLDSCAGRSVRMLSWAVDRAKKSGRDISKHASRALIASSQRGDREIVEYLLRHGADPSSKNARGATALMAAAESGDAKLVDMLLKAGADPLAADKDGDSVAWYAAAGRGGLDVMEKVLSVGGMGSPAQGAEALAGLICGDRDFSDTKNDGSSKMQVAMAKALLAAGADLNRRPGWDGPLLWAVHKEKASLVRLLLAAGADPSVVSQNGRDALALAMEADCEEIALVLLRAGAPWRFNKLVDGNKVSLLMFAREQRWSEAVDWLESNREARSIELAIKGAKPVAAKSLARL